MYSHYSVKVWQVSNSTSRVSGWRQMVGKW